MAEEIFPDKWWTLSKEQYDECKHSPKALLGSSLDDGTKDVSVLCFCG